MTMDLTMHEAVGIALAAGCQSGGSLGDAVPGPIWERLHGYGYVTTVRDFTGDATTIATANGREALRLTLSREDSP